MQPYDLHFSPYPPLYLLAFLLLLGFLVVLLRWGLIRYVYERLGLSRRAAMFLLFADGVINQVDRRVGEGPGGRARPRLRGPRPRPIMRGRRPDAGAR